MEDALKMLNALLADELSKSDEVFYQLEDLDPNSKDWKDLDNESYWLSGRINGIVTAINVLGRVDSLTNVIPS